MKCFLILISAIVALTLARSEFVQADETKSAAGTAAKKLFNGKDLKGWHVDVPHLDKHSDAQSPFIVRDGSLVSLGTPNGHLITDAKYQNYRLEIEYRFAGEPGNCGVLVHASTPRALYRMFPKSIGEHRKPRVEKLKIKPPAPTARGRVEYDGRRVPGKLRQSLGQQGSGQSRHRLYRQQRPDRLTSGRFRGGISKDPPDADHKVQ